MFSYANVETKNTIANEDELAKSDYKSLIIYLEKKFNVVSDYFLDTNGYLSCIYFQDSFMKDVFNFYPDRLCIDISFRCFETDVFMYLFLAEDSNGKNHVVSLGFTVTEDMESLLWLLNTFKRNNPNWRRTKIIVLDSEIKQRDVIHNVFPGPCIVITLQHALKSFKKGIEIINELNVVPVEQIQLSLELFKNMYLVHRQTDYEMYYQQFMLLHGSVVEYFQEVWLPIQNQWRTGLDFYHENIFSSLNFHLEYFDDTIKLISDAESFIFEFIRKVFLMLFLKRNEKVNIALHTSPVLFSRFSPEYQISKILTPYAAKFVVDQFDLSSEIHMDCSVVSDNYIFDNFGSPVNATASMCSCHFYLYTFLPCRHIFAVRKIISLCVLDESLIDNCWSMKYYQNTLQILQNSEYFENSKHNSVSKNSLASHLLESTLPVFLNSSESVFKSQMEILSQLVNFWKSNTETYVEFIGVENELPCVKINCPESNNQESFPVTSEISNSVTCQPIEKENLMSDLVICDENFKQSMWNFRSNILDGKYINYAYLCRIICETKESCLDWLRQMELIPSSVMCPSCNCAMVIKSVPRLSDGAVWVCSTLMATKRYCSRRSSVRQGSWFELTNMAFEQILTFCYMWINKFSQSQIISEIGVSSATYISWNKLNSRVCEEVLLEEGKFSNISNMDSSSSPEVLEMWLQSCGDEDTFVKFLQDANLMHRKDSLKRIMR
ncbi:SWIM-type domain-containing protein [Trichonephila inaurata madagascariensis]|uniref:SWIM-type domain-containing protein n=1 Tax=Trichonephila inaurata madagascariensis TaxID=2747483 RepID=A0A8X7CCF6_9ARAC|nr:SWIM-type domain-containing protein [Trichonephila inaurata madagascariensis]